MRRQFIFCHGFGFDSSFWQNLSYGFTHDECIYLDLGYFGQPSPLKIDDRIRPIIGIGHSIGLIKLLSMDKKFDYLIGLNSFINFCGNDQEVNKKREEELRLLKIHFKRSAGSTLQRFYTRCGVNIIEKQKIENINKEIAVQDLESLSHIYEVPHDTPMLILGAKDDIVVPPAIIYDNFKSCPNVQIEMLDQGGHGLGFIEAMQVQKMIKKFVNYEY